MPLRKKLQRSAMGSLMDGEVEKRMAGPSASLRRCSEKQGMRLLEGIGSYGQSKKQERDFSEGRVPCDKMWPECCREDGKRNWGDPEMMSLHCLIGD